MTETRLIMGMPITVDIVDPQTDDLRQQVFSYFEAVDQAFSPYIDSSEVCRINRGEVSAADASEAMCEVLALAEETRVASDGYFDVRRPTGGIDPSGIVKGWAIGKAAAGRPAFARLAQSTDDLDVAWIVRTNASKRRLAKLLV